MRNSESNTNPNINLINPGIKGNGIGPNPHGNNQGSNINPLNNDSINPGIRGDRLGPNAQVVNCINPRTGKPFKQGHDMPGTNNPSDNLRNQGSNINLNNNFINPGIRGDGLGPNTHGFNQGRNSNINPKTGKPYDQINDLKNPQGNLRNQG